MADYLRPYVFSCRENIYRKLRVKAPSERPLGRVGSLTKRRLGQPKGEENSCKNSARRALFARRKVFPLGQLLSLEVA